MRSEDHNEIANSAVPRAQLQHVYWIGGGSAANKSTIAQRIATRDDMQVYSTDTVMTNHANRSTPDESPYLSMFKTMDMDQRRETRLHRPCSRPSPGFAARASA